MGMSTEDKHVDVGVIEMYRREGCKLSEKWIFSEFLHFWHQQGVDILERIKES